MVCVALLVCVGLGQGTISRNGIQDDSERWGLKHGLYAMEEQSCPTWYLETKHNAVTRYVWLH